MDGYVVDGWVMHVHQVEHGTAPGGLVVSGVAWWCQEWRGGGPRGERLCSNLVQSVPICGQVFVVQPDGSIVRRNYVSRFAELCNKTEQIARQAI